MLKDIKGFEGLYAITDDGRVWSYPKEGSGGHNGKWLKPRIDKHGYLTVALCKDNKQYRKLIHRLVAEAFIENQNNYLTVDHINRNKLNNNVSNLRWATYSMQNSNQDRNSEKYKESRKRSIKKANEANKKKVRCIETNIIYESGREASKQTGINFGSICLVCRGKHKTAGGYHWEFINDKTGNIDTIYSIESEE